MSTVEVRGLTGVASSAPVPTCLSTELGGTTGPDNNNGSSLGDTGSIGAFRSMFSGSFFAEGISTFNAFLLPFALSAVPPPSFAFGLMLRPPTDFCLLDFEIVGVTMTSLGGVNTSLEGSYEGMFVKCGGDCNSIRLVRDVNLRLVGVAHC